MDLVDLIDLTDETDVQEAKHSTNQSDETVFILKSKVKDELIAHLDFLSDSLKKGHPITEFEINKTDELKKQLNNLPESKKTKSSPAKSTPREVKLIQMQLVLLLHAFKCRNNAKKDVSCRLRYCQRYKNILDHLDSCNQGKEHFLKLIKLINY